MPTPLDVARRALAPAPVDGTYRVRYIQGIRCSRMHPHTRLVALTLASYAGPNGTIADADQPGLLGLVEATGLTAGRIAVQLRTLEGRGWIRPVRGARYEVAHLALALPQYRADQLRR
ncbi:hypothetical protein ACFQ7B_07700 [Streptomyces erythrochromogenes]|uniref:hypothetical protein n=1 Tax=Streptomyces erythrochromogenes TaxID=285574 RepID=UPI0036B1E4CB